MVASDRFERGTLLAALLVCLLVRAWNPFQPIWEGYIGRQVPTAMVARNLSRDGDFLHPKLDTGPFPSYFLVEPPIYGGLVAAATRVGPLSLEANGRLISAAATTLAAWGLFGLVRRRESAGTALVALLFFSAFPVMIKFGRAFQPDALMLGLVLSGLNLREHQSRAARSLGWCLVSIGLATKLTGIFLVMGHEAGVWTKTERSGKARLSSAIGLLLPAALWYTHAALLMQAGGGEAAASAENASNWASRLGSLAGWSPWFLFEMFARAFTPLTLLAMTLQIGSTSKLDPLWKAWIVSTLVGFLVLAGKLHHEYYQMLAAPIVAVLAARGLCRMAELRPRSAGLIGAMTLLMCCLLAIKSWRTPAEWLDLSSAGREVQAATRPDDVVIAPEALIYASDRKGCRFETQASAVRRAAREWGGSSDTPEQLVAFYRDKGRARHFATLQNAPENREAIDAIKRRPDSQIIIDRPNGLILIRFAAEGPLNVESR